MKRTIEILLRLVAPPARLVALLFAVVTATGTVLAAAPVPTVMWDGDFSSLSKTVGGVTYTINNTSSGNSVAADYSYIQVANSDNDYAAPTITASGGDAPFGSSDGSTVLIFVSNMQLSDGSNRAVLSFMDEENTYNGGHVRFGITRANGSASGITYGGRNAGGFIAGGSININAGTGINASAFYEDKQSIALTYKQAEGLVYYVNAVKKGSYNPQSSFSSPSGVCVGGVDYTRSGSFYAMKNMKVHTIAIFDRELTQEEIAEYESQSKWRYCDAIAWRNTSGDFHASTYAPVGSISCTPSVSNTRSYNTSGFPWKANLTTDAKFPIAIIYDDRTKQQSCGGDFSNLWLGGLYVNAAPSSGDFTLTGKNANGTRETFLGDRYGIHESWFVFNENYKIDREGSASSGNSRIYGTANIHIESGKTFNFNSTAETRAGTIVLTAGSVDNTTTCLKMSGTGRFVVNTLDATNGCLDYSALDAATQSTTPFIDGNLAVDATTKFKFPSVGGAASYRLATALTADVSIPSTTFTIGDNEYTAPLTLTASGGTVEFPALATLAAGSLEVASAVFWPGNPPHVQENISWDAAPATVNASTTPVVINVTDDTLLAPMAAISVKSLVFNIAPGKTLGLYPSAVIFTTDGITVTGGGTLRIYETTTVNGDMTIADDATLAFESGKTLTVYGTLTVASGKTLTVVPGSTLSAVTTTLVTATSIDGTVTISTSGLPNTHTYTPVIDSTSVKISRVLVPSKTYTAAIGSWTASGWGNFAGGTSVEKVRVGPNATLSTVFEISDGFNPYVGFQAPSSSGWSFSVYADVSKASDSTTSRPVLACFGDNNSSDTLLLYREGNNVRLRRHKNGNAVGNWAAAVPVSEGFHLWTFACDPTTGTVALYVDGGSASSNAGESSILFGEMNLPAGFQLGKAYGATPSGFATGEGIAVASFQYYDAYITAEEAALLAAQYPATDGTKIYGQVDNLGAWNNHQTENNTMGSSLTVYSGAYPDDATTGKWVYLGISQGSLTIPAGNTVSVPFFKTNNKSLAGNVTVNIAGSLNVTSTADSDIYGANKGILFGHYTGTGEYNITGELIGRNTYLMGCFSAGAQTINVNGGLLAVKGFSMRNGNGGNATINLTNNGTVEVAAPQTFGNKDVIRNFGYGTYKVVADVTDSKAINFSAASGNATTLDPYGHTLTLESAALTGRGDITVADSSDGAAGKVVFPAGSGYTGRLILTDDNAANMDISAYKGKIVLRGTAAATIAELNNFAGVVIIDAAGTYDATAIDLSGATVQISHADAELNATAGKEGNVAVIAGTCNLYADNNTFRYDGHIFTGGVNDTGATLAYYHSEAGSAGSLAWNSGAAFTVAELAEVKSGNNIAPYFKIFTGHEDGDDMAGSLATATDWNGHTAGDETPTGGNMAIRVADGKTLTVEVPSAVSFGEVQVFGSGSVVFTGEAALTITKGMYVTPGTTVALNETHVAFSGDGNPGVHVDYGLTAATSGTVVLADGTAQSPYAPYIYGQGAVVVSEGAVASLANQQGAIAYLTVDGTATAAVSATALAALSTLTVSATGVLDVPDGATVSPVTLAVNGTMNMASTATLSGVTTLSGTGTVVWNEKNPDQAASDGIWTSNTWSGTNYVKNITAEAERPVYYWGRNGSYVKLENVKGWLAHNAVINAEVVLANGNGSHGLEISNGNTQDAPTYFRKLSGSGTFKQTGTGGNQRYVLRDVSDFTGSIEKTDTVRVLIIDATTYQASLPARNDNGGKMFVANITAKIGDGNSWSVRSGKTIDIAGTATVELLGAASMTGAVTFGNGATLTFDDIGTSEAQKKLRLNSAVTVASADTVNIALSAEAAAALYDRAVLIDWTAAPAGSFAFSNSALADSWVLFKDATGLVVYDKTIEDTTQKQAAVLDIDDSGALVAVVTPTGNAITLPAIIRKMTLSVSASQLANITAPGVAVDDVVVKYGDTVTTEAYSITKNGDVISFDINTAEDASVTIGNETIKVQPETAALSAAGPSFTLKTIPGLWYRAAVCASPDGTFVSCGDAVQATSTSTTVNGTAEWGSGEKVRYYRIKAGVASDL